MTEPLSSATAPDPDLPEIRPAPVPDADLDARLASGFGMARRIGVVGGGQLARMMQPAAVNLGIELLVLSETDSDPAAQVVPQLRLGSHLDAEAVTAFAQDCDALTFDHEHVPQSILKSLELAAVRVRPGSQALIHAQDKIVMRQHLTELGFPSPVWAVVTTRADVQAFGDRADVGWPIIIKTSRGGYDGKGVRVVNSPEEVADWLERVAEIPLLAEAMVPFKRELAALVARTPSGVTTCWPVVQTLQRDGVCFEVTSPAPDLNDQAALQELAQHVATSLGSVGVLAVELFETAGANGQPQYVINELAMRPHNSGHWSQDGCVTSQFEQHLRAVAGLPLGDTSATAPWTVMVNLLGDTEPDLLAGAALAVAADPAIKVHLYGKAVKPGRKVGHVNLSGADLNDVRTRALRAAQTIVSGPIVASTQPES